MPEYEELPLRRASDRDMLIRNDQRLDSVERAVEDVGHRFDEYVTKDQFKPVMLIVYGIATAILTGVGGAILNLVIKQGG